MGAKNHKLHMLVFHADLSLRPDYDLSLGDLRMVGGIQECVSKPRGHSLWHEHLQHPSQSLQYLHQPAPRSCLLQVSCWKPLSSNTQVPGPSTSLGGLGAWALVDFQDSLFARNFVTVLFRYSIDCAFARLVNDQTHCRGVLQGIQDCSQAGVGIEAALEAAFQQTGLRCLRRSIVETFLRGMKA